MLFMQVPLQFQGNLNILIKGFACNGLHVRSSSACDWYIVREGSLWAFIYNGKPKASHCSVWWRTWKMKYRITEPTFPFLFFLLLDTQLMLFSYGEFQMLKLNPSEMVVICGDREKAKATTTTNNCIVPLRSMWCSIHWTFNVQKDVGGHATMLDLLLSIIFNAKFILHA